MTATNTGGIDDRQNIDFPHWQHPRLIQLLTVPNTGSMDDRDKYWQLTLAAPRTDTNTDCQHWWHRRQIWILTAHTGSTQEWYKYWWLLILVVWEPDTNTDCPNGSIYDWYKYWLPTLAAPTTDTNTNGYQHRWLGRQTQIMTAHTGST